METLARRSLASVWHPCTQMQHMELSPPLAIARGNGSYLYDESGKEYLDAISSWWTCLLGHNHPAIQSALTDQLSKLDHVMLAGFTHEPVVKLSEKLTQLTGLGHAFYGSDGSCSVEIALKISAHYWRNKGLKSKCQFLALEGGYHGETMGALGVTDIPLFRQSYGPLIQMAQTVPVPTIKPNQSDEAIKQEVSVAISKLEQILQKNKDYIACLIVEPLIQCARGMVVYPAAYLNQAFDLCQRYQLHLIVDEIAVGFGRTGSLFAFEQAGIKPDLICLSKGITGGTLPLSATLVSEEIYRSFWHEDLKVGFLHSHSYTGNPLACRAALATLHALEDENTIFANRKKSKDFSAIFSEISNWPWLENARHLGMIWAWDVKSDYASENFSRLFFFAALNAGAIVRPIGRTIYFMPPYSFDNKDAHRLKNAVLQALEATVTSHHTKNCSPHQSINLP